MWWRLCLGKDNFPSINLTMKIINDQELEGSKVL